MKTNIQVENLKCGGCAATINKGILEIEGVSEVQIDVDSSVISVISEDALDLSKIKRKLANMGYPEVGEKNNLLHKTKSYISCATGKMSS
jgi:copper chaperone|uniref:heavy-metal-associated domain-containing protein n=1 Tax=Polaribacter sp. TaxID=1920175 RepID=UPI0040489CD5